jgi:hypothetical protein
MFGSFEILAGDFVQTKEAGASAQFVGGAFHLTVKEANKKWYQTGLSSVTIKADQIESLDVATEENLKKMGGSIGWGLVGGLALGGVGAIAGLLAGGRSKEVTFICKFKDGRKFLGKCDSKIFTNIQAACF